MPVKSKCVRLNSFPFEISMIEGSLEPKDIEKRRKIKIREEKESEEGMCRCTKR